MFLEDTVLDEMETLTVGVDVEADFESPSYKLFHFVFNVMIPEYFLKD